MRDGLLVLMRGAIPKTTKSPKRDHALRSSIAIDFIIPLQPNQPLMRRHPLSPHY